MERTEKEKTAKKRSALIITAVLFCCAAMAFIDGVLRPPYAVKSAVKVVLFLALPLLCVRFCGGASLKTLFSAPRGTIFRALLLGAGVFALILLAAFLLREFIDAETITALLGENAGVTGDNFLAVALYISLFNSLLEELFFRGFAFLSLREYAGERFSCAFSALIFALYHTAMMLGGRAAAFSSGTFGACRGWCDL